jgi:hypothetical protein
MAKKDEVTGITSKVTPQPVEKQEAAAGKTVKPPNGKKKKKHQSAIVAAAQAASVLSETNARSSGDIGFGSTGTNLTYKEDGGIL